MKLQKFDKNRKKKAYVIGGIAFVFAAIIGIVLYRSYALYQEKKSFDVLNGTIPDFASGDIQLAITVDGQTASSIPSKGDYSVTVDCGDTATGAWDSDAWGAKITDIKVSKVKCNVDFRQQVLADVAKVGDYVRMSPDGIIPEFPSTMLGTSENTGFNPQELNLWRIIRKNADGTMDMVSDSVSSANVTFKGQIGYLHFVNMLNYFASSYENPKYTSGSRHIGYNGQTLDITDTSRFTIIPPFTESTTDNSNETQGGGDILHKTDVDLVKNVYGNLSANKAGSSSLANYWLASRRYRCDVGGNYAFIGRTDNDNNPSTGASMYYGSNGNFTEHSVSYALRPILVLKAKISVPLGTGSSDSPWVLD